MLIQIVIYFIMDQFIYYCDIINGMQLRNIQNISPTRRNKNKIEHQIDNEGCKCDLCQKIVINEMRVIKTYHIEDTESELTKGKREQFFSRFLIEFNAIDKMNRKVKMIFPEVCVFEKGVPVCLITKKRQTLPMKLIKNKQKLNGFEIHNFFVDGFTFHNNFKERLTSIQVKNRADKQDQNKVLVKYRKDYFNFDEALRTQCIVLAKYSSGTCQMMTPIELTNLFKSKQKQLRQDIIYISTMVCSSNYNQIRISVNLAELEGTGLLERAKNQVKMINQDIKPRDFQFIPERQERKFEQVLKDEDPKKYLQYVSLKMALLYSLKTDILFKNSLFKYVKDEIDSYYLVDIQVYQKTSGSKLWGTFDANKAFIESPDKEKKRIRPTSSPERLQKQREANKNKVNGFQLDLIRQ